MKKKMAWPILIFLVIVFLAMFLFQYALNRTIDSEANIYADYNRHYALITDGEDEEFWGRVYAGALEEGREGGVYVERFGEQLSSDYGRNDLLKIAVWASVDGIIVPGDEDEETIELLDQAVKEGIPVVTVLRDSSGSLRQCFVGNNSYNLGQEYGRQILAILRERKTEDGANPGGNRAGSADAPARVLVLTDESRMDSSQNLILLGIRETLENEAGAGTQAEVETMAIDSSRNFSPEESIRDIFLSPEGLPDILVCLNAVYTRCAYQAAVDYNQVGTVQMLGYYDSDAILDAVAKNIIFATISPDSEQMGRLCVQALEEYAQTGYTNNYMAVDTRLFTAKEAAELLNQDRSEDADAID